MPLPCYFGAWATQNDNFTDWSGMTPFEAGQSLLKSSTMYIGWNTPFSYFGAFNTTCHNNGAVMYLNIEPWNTYGGGANPSMIDIANGVYDSYLTTLATDLLNDGFPVLITFAHEMNGTWYPWGAQAITPAQWQAAWKHVYTIFHNVMGSLVTMVWCPNNNDVGSVTPYWPGQAFVDLAAADMYLNASGQTFNSFNLNTVNEIKGLTTGPVWNAETGWYAVGGGYTITQWMSDMENAGLYGMVYWNEGSYTINSSQITELTNAVVTWNNDAGSGPPPPSISGNIAITFRPSVSASSSVTPPPTGTLSRTIITPDHVAWNSTAHTYTSVTSFTPPANSLVRVSFSAMFDSGNTNPVTFTCADSASNAYTQVIDQPDAYNDTYNVFFEHQYATSPGAITLTITSTVPDTATYSNALIQPYVYTGQATDQSTAMKTGTNTSSSSSTPQVTGNTTVTGSMVDVAACISQNTIPSVISGTTQDDFYDDSKGTGAESVAGHATSISGAPGPVTLGWTTSPASPFGWGAAMAEVIPGTATSITGSISTTFAPSVDASSFVQITGNAAVKFDAQPLVNALSPKTFNQAYIWDGTQWQPYQWGTDSIASSAITTVKIADGSVTANKLIANLIVAGIIDGTTVQAPNIIGGTITGAQVIVEGSNGEILVYSGTPALGNLIMSVSAMAGTDSFGNVWKTGTWVYGDGNSEIGLVPGTGNAASIQLAPGTTPPATIDKVPQLFGNTSGNVSAVDGTDSQAYTVSGRRSIVSGTGTINNDGTWQTIHSSRVAAPVGSSNRRYRVRGLIYMTPSATLANSFNVKWTGPSGILGLITFNWHEGSSTWTIGGLAPNVRGTLTITPSANTTYECFYDGVIEVVAGTSGDLEIQGTATSAESPWGVSLYGYIDVMPV